MLKLKWRYVDVKITIFYPLFTIGVVLTADGTQLLFCQMPSFQPHWHSWKRENGPEQNRYPVGHISSCLVPLFQSEAWCTTFHINYWFTILWPRQLYPSKLEKLLHSDCEQRSTPQIIIEEMTCKRSYTKLLSLKHQPPPTCENKLLTLGYRKDDLSRLRWLRK